MGPLGDVDHQARSARRGHGRERSLPPVGAHDGSPNRPRKIRRDQSPVVTGDLAPSEKLVAGSRSAQTLQKPDVSSPEELPDATPLEELITASPQTVPHDTIDGSSSTVPLICEKLVSDVLDCASTKTMQEEDITSSKEFLDNSSSEDSGTTSTQTALQSTSDDSPPSASSLGSKILVRRPRSWYQSYHIRMNRCGTFSMYPDLGGPFQSIDEAGTAINCHIEQRCQAKRKEKDSLSPLDRLIYDHKHYLDGTPKRGPNSPSTMNPNDDKEYFVQAIMDKYNDDNNLSGNSAHEIECLQRHQIIFEYNRWFYHFNFTTKTKDAGDRATSCNQFFAEVSRVQGEDVWECYCYGCSNNGNPGMKHPDNTGAYIGGHLDRRFPVGEYASSDSEDEQAVEDRLRNMFQGLDDPDVLDSLYHLTMEP
ncbi:hypothetical protein ACP70R_011851 [Stipagrostis hirtigluma subsp. patula]